MLTVSVLMATYNRENTIEEAILSIINQLSEQDELIISDDGSTDDTLKICNNLQAKYPKIIKIFTHENYKIDKNMQYLFSLASKDIIIINDSDDISMPNRVQVIKETFESHTNISCIYHNGYIINEDNQITDNNFLVCFHQQNKFSSIIKYTTFYGAFMCFRLTFVKENNCSLNSKLSWDRTLGFISFKQKSILFLDKKLLKYRRWDNNASKKKKTSIFKKISTRLSWLRFYLKIKKK